MKPSYDPESDSMYLRLRSEKAYESIELNNNILIDISRKTKQIVGIELVDTSEFLSRLFARKIDKAAIKSKLKLHLNRENEQELFLNIEFDKEKYNYVIPKAYESPILAV